MDVPKTPVGPCTHLLGRNTNHRCRRGTDGCVSDHTGVTFTRGLGVHLTTEAEAQLIAEAAEAQERFGDDELERFAREGL